VSFLDLAGHFNENENNEPQFFYCFETKMFEAKFLHDIETNLTIKKSYHTMPIRNFIYSNDNRPLSLALYVLI
jgi:hypothetical protein